jgi:hypothetical protein
MLNLITLISLFLFVTSAQAQTLDLTQSLPSHKWQTISNDFVEVIYPESMQKESVYVANLVEHYAKVVGLTYEIQKPEKFTLVLRPDNAEPNGFVTLGPRRSEWYASTMFTPFVGSAEWFQVLSIHEYRHLMQYDHFNRKTVKALYYIMGDMGRFLATFLALPSWYFEGDAVWAETKYTDTGRGRSPRFLARLKALVLGDKIPTYDQFLNGTYTNDLPNQYIYGYALISYGTQKYGADLWQRVIRDVSKLPNPFRLYTSFKNVTGQSFEAFYNEAMNDLKTKWSKDAIVTQKGEFRDQISPTPSGTDLFYVERDLDEVSRIVKETAGKKVTLAKIPFTKEFSWIHFGATKAVYGEFIPHPRFGYAGESNLVLIDLKKGQRKVVTHNRRLYNPALNAAETKVIAAEFKPDQTWNISEFDLNGKELKSFGVSLGKPVFVNYINDNQVVALVNTSTGEKTLVEINLQDNKITQTLIAPTKNLINGIQTDSKGNIFFEAQYKGSTDIFKFDARRQLAKCTASKIGAYTPSSDGVNIHFSTADALGSVAASMPISDCQTIAVTELSNFKFLGDSPSDNYNNFERVTFVDQDKMYTQNKDKYKSEDYSEFDERLFVPHTWGLAVGRGAALQVLTDNYLRTMSIGGFVGQDAEEGGNFAEVGLTYKKYYPIFALSFESREREVTDIDANTESTWDEQSARFVTLLPYYRRSGIRNFNAALSLEAGYTDASDYKFNNVKSNRSDSLMKTAAEISLSWYRDLAPRSIMAPWLVSYSYRIDNAEERNDSIDGTREFHSAQVQTPSLFKHDGFKITFDQQDQDKGTYRFVPQGIATGYAFSRGYDYKDVPKYTKVTANYFFPLMSPDFTLGGWFYLRRAYANLFYDSTDVESTLVSKTLDSFGAELLFESKVLRILPITFGVRHGKRTRDDKEFTDIFLASGLDF